MQILRSGKECYIQQCQHCNCLFSYGRGDVNIYKEHQVIQYVIKCPECGEDLVAKFKKRIEE